MIAEVIVDISSSEVDKVFDYIIPDDSGIAEGDRVEVPFGRMKTEGFVIAVKSVSECTHTLKPIIRKLDEFTAILPEMFELMRYMKAEYNLRLVDVLRLFVPSMMRGGRVKEVKRKYVKIADGVDAETLLKDLKANAAAQRGIISRLTASGGEWAAALAEEFSAAAVTALQKKGYLSVEEIAKQRTPFKSAVCKDKKVVLSREQTDIANSIMNSSGTTLLHGVTGSGKTEIYLDCIGRIVAQGKKAVMLVPEISLTPQMMRRFRGRFGDKVALLHSGLSGGERYDEWLRLLRGEAVIAVGARSAIFAPLKDIGIIIIDEEHDTSYISESNPRYVTSDIAEYRRAFNNAIMVVGSATPSIESYRMAETGVYNLITMKSRINNVRMPEIVTVDMCAELKNGNNSILSSRLTGEIAEALNKGNQSMIFLNRRGFASFMICRKCGKVLKCTDCDVSLTWHKEDNLLKCHYCGKRFTVPSVCPECGSESIRLGKVGTERVVADIQKLFPGARMLRMDNDTTRKKGSYDEILSAFASGEADILVGTQMIAKGHDFPNVTLVGILDADMSLYYGDYHSAERTYQLVTQMAGRAGRADKTGLVILQTYSPNHHIFKYSVANDYVGFYNKECNIREVTSFPPFSKIVRVLISAEDEMLAQNTTKSLLSKMRALQSEMSGEFISLQAMKAPVKKIEKKYRYQILMRLKRERDREIIQTVYHIVDSEIQKNLTVFVEINPQNLN